MKPIIVITGVSGSGKTTLSQLFPVERRIVSYTTRNPRPGEIDGIDYYFVTKEQGEEIKNSENSFEDTCFAGNVYGVTKDEVIDKSVNWKYHTVLVAEAGFYKDVSVTEDGQFLYKGQYQIRPIIEAIKERGGEEANQRILNLAKEEKTIVDLMERFPDLEVFDVLFDLGVTENQNRFKDFLGLSKTK